MQQLTGMFERVVNRFNYTLNIINDTIMIVTNELQYHKAVRDILKEKKLHSTHNNFGNNVSTEW
jgi:transketolase N-terminal domain/subunit